MTRLVLGLAAALAGCAPAPCGPGTLEIDGVCHADEALSCGPGTWRDGQACVADPLSVTLDVAVDVHVPCGDDTVLHEGLCVGAGLQHIHLPFPAGAEVTVSQGHNGWFSHHEHEEWAVDFPVDDGSVIVAAMPGVVWSVKDDSAEGCPEEECRPLGNRVIIDHGDGSRSAYWHLQHQGALVSVGERVGRGQPIGLSGSTGWSTAPHLHLVVTDLLGYSLPLRFAEVDNGGVIYAGGWFVSQNTEEPPPPELTWSACPADLYRPLGVTLTSAVPCSVARSGEVHQVTGIVTGPRLIIGLWSSRHEAWAARCVQPDPSGHFAVDLVFDREALGLRTHLVLQSADESCKSYQGFHATPSILVDPTLPG